jgi:glutaredoxin 3
MEPRRCGVHGLVVGSDGRCVVCRRGDPELGTPTTSREWPLVIALSFFAALIVFSGGYWLTRKLAAMSTPPPAVTAVIPTATAEEAAPAEEPRRSVNTAPRVVGEAPRPPERPVELSDEQLEKLKRNVKVTMYSTGLCSLCGTARTFLKNRKYKLSELDIEASPTDKVLLEAINPAASVPTFDVEGRVLIGYDRQSLDRAIEDAARARQRL